MTFSVNGVDLLPFLSAQGFKVTRNDEDSPDSGRSIDGTMYRDRVAIKKRIDATCRDLNGTEAATVLTAILPQWVTVVYTDPQLNADVTATMYSNNVPATFARKNSDGVYFWTGITFPLIEA